MATLRTDGLDDLFGKLKAIEKGVKVSTNDLMTDDFIRRYTKFNSWQDMLDAGAVKSNEDILSNGFSAFVTENTPFPDFNAMLGEASEEYLARQLDL